MNCGHLAGLLLRENGDVGRLESTSTVLGMFERWECVTAEVQVAPGDTLLLYTDGIIEAAGDDGREFGEDRLLEALRRHRHLAASQLAERILKEVEEFGGHEQQDDMTLVIARAHREKQ